MLLNTSRDLNYGLYLQKMSGFTRTDFNSEFEQYHAIQSGDVERVKARFEDISRDFMKGKGELSDDPVRNLVYHFVVSTALTSRICVQGGMSHDTAYTLSDIYIRKADKAADCESVIALFEEMQVDFASRMREMHKGSAISVHVRRCIDYIYENLHTELSVTKLANREKLNPSYLSKLFKKETGVSVTDFVAQVRVRTAQNMLTNSDFSYLDIALALGFSSQSAFISVFRKLTGTTPKAYRDAHYMKNI